LKYLRIFIFLDNFEDRVLLEEKNKVSGRFYIGTYERENWGRVY
jgi:hypothetical protein